MKTFALAGSLPLALASLALTATAAAQPAPTAGPPPLSPGVVREVPAGHAGHNVYRPANLAAVRTPLPVIVWGNGGCAVGDPTWTILFDRWARAGYFVITIHKPEEYAAMAARMAAAQRPGAPPATPAVPGGAPPAGAMNKPGSQAFVTAEDQRKSIDWATAANKSGPYAGKLDLSKVVAAGNSCGGISSLTLTSTEPRVKSVFVLSGSSVGPMAKAEDVAPTMSKVRAPVIWVVGGPQDIAGAAADLDYSLQPAGQGGVIIKRSSFDHRTVSTDPDTLRQVAEMGVLWFRATLNHDAAAARTLTTKVCDQCDAATWSVAKAKNLAAR